MNIFEILLLLALALIVVGPERLPEVLQMVGKVLRELRMASNTVMRELTEVTEEPRRSDARDGSVSDRRLQGHETQNYQTAGRTSTVAAAEAQRLVPPEETSYPRRSRSIPNWPTPVEADVPAEGLRMPIMEHLRELRVRLIRAAIALTVGFIVAYFFSDQLFAAAHDADPAGLAR